ncbi:hypothetical protein PY257_01230 [Ramlibacter sp. H39-3-26]|uniref:hypothetical protein n=1 Tax=Curvibacter soli TaxID=3031331 RepID=UPI0023DAFD3A|nr:hypothetical protein [Ramlibacter sp. H39-3-26]MDF1483820.1 hypothetical protein [Ramlibacter sp. H39-3-26]
MNQPTPAIVSQDAVRRLPRWALLLFCVVYIVPGFVGRSPWRNDDVTAFGYMAELAAGRSGWLHPTLAGLPPDTTGPLPYWLGAWALRIAPPWIPPDLAARLPFMALLALTLAATWYSVYYLARRPEAQPVAFAFGGEALPADYARAVADGGLLALIACLGLAQLSHEGTAYLAQLSCTTLMFFAFAATPYRTWMPAIALLAGQAGLALSGAPTLAALFGMGGALLHALEPQQEPRARRRGLRWAAAIAACTAAVAALGAALGLWGWRIAMPDANGGMQWQSLGRLLLWFTWPAWPLGLLTLWRWRRQVFSRELPRHLVLPLGFAAVTLAATLLTLPRDRALMQGLPALAALAAFALPTLSRNLAALIDWFTLLFFTVCAIAIWVIWISMETGFPAKPAANVARLAPDFTPTFSWPGFLAALAATLVWCALVWWRTGRHRAALWKSLVLPAGGTALCWLLLMTIWLPLLDFARSYAPQVRNVVAVTGQPACVHTWGFDLGQTAAFRYHGGLTLVPVQAGQAPSCPWLLVDGAALPTLAQAGDTQQWVQRASVQRPTDRDDRVFVFQRRGP